MKQTKEEILSRHYRYLPIAAPRSHLEIYAAMGEYAKIIATKFIYWAELENNKEKGSVFLIKPGNWYINPINEPVSDAQLFDFWATITKI